MARIIHPGIASLWFQFSVAKFGELSERVLSSVCLQVKYGTVMPWWPAVLQVRGETERVWRGAEEVCLGGLKEVPQATEDQCVI